MVSLRLPARHAKTMRMNNESPFAVRISLDDLAATEALGARIAAGLRKGDAVALAGDLGAGKTTLARAILSALAVTENMPSPTFTLVQTYETPGLTVRHFDFYRIEDEREIEELGLDEAVDEGAVLIEWPERAGSRMPENPLYVSLTATGVQSRRAEITGPARWAPFLSDNPLDR
jgi:tRNA threonylcarbamoyladenosine biosynthesis protein TsaE